MSCDIATTVQNAIDTYGRTARLKRTIPGAYDPVTGTEGAEVVIYYAVKALQVNPDKSQFADSYEVGDQIVDLSAALQTDPDITTDILMFGTDEWRILGLDTHYVADTQVKHTLHLKQ